MESSLGGKFKQNVSSENYGVTLSNGFGIVIRMPEVVGFTFLIKLCLSRISWLCNNARAKLAKLVLKLMTKLMRLLAQEIVWKQIKQIHSLKRLP